MTRPTLSDWTRARNSLRLVGRDTQLQRLHELLADVSQGRGGVAWIEGEPGIGKSALLTAGLAGAEAAGCQLLMAACDELSQRLPLRVMLDCLWVHGRSRDPRRAEIAQFLDPPAGAGGGFGTPAPISAAVERLLGLVDRLCADAPVVLVVDDLQWADEASLLVWQRLSLAVRQVPLLLVGACRPVPRRAELSAMRSRLREPEAVLLHLDALSPTETDEVAAHLLGKPPSPGLLRELDRAAGNPLYITELVNALSHEPGLDHRGSGERVPAALAEAIAARFGFLSEATIEVLGTASLLGTEFSVSDLVLVAGQSARALVRLIGEATASGVLIEAGVRLKFRHPLFRHALYSRMPVSLREALHRQAAEALAETGAPIERVAQQLLLVSELDDSWSLGWLTATAHELTYRAPTVALELIGRGVKHVRADDPRREILDTELATAAFLLARHDDLLAVAQPLLTRTSNSQRAAETTWLVAYTLMRLGRFDEAIATLHDALMRPGLSDLWAARLRAVEATVLLSAGRYEEAEQMADTILRDDHDAADRLTAGYSWHVKSMVDYRLHHSLASFVTDTGRGLEVVGDNLATSDLRLLLLLNSAGGLVDLDRWHEAENSLKEARVLAERIGSARRGHVGVITAVCYYHRGLWDEALAELESVTDLPETQHLPVLLHGLLALIAGHRDDQTTVSRHLEEVASVDPIAPITRTNVIFLVMARALAAERKGDAREAADILSIITDERASDMDERHLALPELARLLLAVDDRAAFALAARVAEGQRDLHADPDAATAHSQGVFDANPELLITAAEYYRTASRPLGRARALEDAGVLYAEQGKPGHARDCLKDAISIYTGLGAAWDIRRADTRLRAHGIRRGSRGPRHRPATGWEALTPTERRVAELVAQGRSNPDIAVELFLSRSTVQTHVSHILAKLGLHSRGQVAGIAQQHTHYSTVESGS
jgi:DNA-binding CsgD family transcriptional regulator/tetratricopeptide (TPR) repeat protein